MIYRLLVGNSVDPDQMTSMKLADLDPHCFQDSFCSFVCLI